MSEPHRATARVYYEDTDMAGVVYHANYLKYIERARSDALREAGVDQRAMRDAGAVFVVTRITADFQRPARYDDVLDVETRALKVARAYADLLQTITRAGQPIFRAEVRIASIDMAGRPLRLPDVARAALARLAPHASAH